MLEAYAGAPDAFVSTAEERAAEAESWWIRRISDPAGLTTSFGAFEKQELLGTIALEFSAKPKTRHKALLIGMYVKPEARRKGFGKALVETALNHLKDRNHIAMVTLTVTEGNASAIKLYREAGFEEFGVEPMAILTPDGYRTKVHMWRRI